jgi:hypothetical protein
MHDCTCRDVLWTTRLPLGGKNSLGEIDLDKVDIRHAPA